MRFIGNVEKDAQVRAVASGALPSGDAVIVNSDGTVSISGYIPLEPPTSGTPVVFESADSRGMSATFDVDANKVVITYSDDANGGYGTAVVGTVSGVSISFGTPVVFESASVFATSAVFDSSNSKVVVAYADNGNSGYGTAIVGTVSGTSISFGTPAVFESALSNDISCAFDSISNKVIIGYQDAGNNYAGTAVVGTVSGTSISFGTPVVFAASGSRTATVFDSNSDKTVIAYRDGGNSGYGTAIVGTVSGTSISFGSSVVFASSSSLEVVATFDSNSNSIVVAYRDLGNSSYGTSAVGSVSGTSISFGTPVVFNSGSTTEVSITFDTGAAGAVICYRENQTTGTGRAIVGTVSGTSISFGTFVVFESGSTSEIAATFDSVAGKVVVAYADIGNTSFGTASVVTTSTATLTSENFLGFAAHTYADTQSALVNSTCTVDRNQTGLTAGQTYYVQNDGSLGTTAADPSVVAGTAISSTEIIVKG